MKKVFLLLAVGLLLASCSGSASTESTESNQDSTAAALEQTADSVVTDQVVAE